jgi:Lon-like ATP-dependent protease
MEKDDAESITEKYQARLQNLKLSSAVKEVIDEEINKLKFLDNHSSEFNVTRNGFYMNRHFAQKISDNFFIQE